MQSRKRQDHGRSLRRLRGQWARVALTVGALALAFALMRIQLMGSQQYAIVAKENRLRPVVTRAPRGTIYDRHGQVVAENVVAYQVLLMPAPLDSIRSSLDQLTPVLGLSEADIAVALRRHRRDPHLPLEVLRNASPGAVARLEERRFLFPGVMVNAYPKRHYPAGPSVAHLIGYVAEISREELELPEFRNFRQGRWIGKSGLERAYESDIGGDPGMEYLAVDAMGRIKQWMPEETGLPPIPGRDLQLHLDLDLQRYLMEIFPAGFRGAFAAVDPQTGGVLAMHSTPGFDPNLFIGGIDSELWEELSNDPAHPLLNRAGASTQPPGSTFKLPTAMIAMSLGLLGPGDRMPRACSGGLNYQGRYSRCWGVHGSLKLEDAIRLSCNVYFYQVGILVGFKQFLEQGTRLGFGSPTGVELPTELASTFPSTPDVWVQRWGYTPADNEVMSLSIGQGLSTVSPLKLAQLYVPLARADGKMLELRLAKTDEPTPAIDWGLSPEQINALREGMRRVVAPGGTARRAALPDWDFMGKTGTAQNPHGENHGVFVGIGAAKGQEPEIILTMLLEHGRAGSNASTYVANGVNFYLTRLHRIPFRSTAAGDEEPGEGDVGNTQPAPDATTPPGENPEPEPTNGNGN